MKISRAIIGATLLTASAVYAATRPAPSQDVVKVAGDSHTVIFENDQVRVLAVHFKPGQTAPMHSQNHLAGRQSDRTQPQSRHRGLERRCHPRRRKRRHLRLPASPDRAKNSRRQVVGRFNEHSKTKFVILRPAQCAGRRTSTINRTRTHPIVILRPSSSDKLRMTRFVFVDEKKSLAGECELTAKDSCAAGRADFLLTTSY